MDNWVAKGDQDIVSMASFPVQETEELSEIDIDSTNLVKYVKTKNDTKWQYYKFKWDKEDPLNTKSKCHVIYE